MGARFAGAALLLALAGCGNGVGSYDPVVWWHHLEGGEIARDRPPPPGINAPYPNLALIPAKPQALSEADRAKAAEQLMHDRANGQYALAQGMPAAAPVPAAPPPPAQGAMGARMAAVGEAPTAGHAAPSAPGAASAATPAAPSVATAPALAALAVPAGPPPPPNLPGVPWLTRPTPLPQAPPKPPTPPAMGKGAPVAVGFARGSAVLSAEDRSALQGLAASRGASVVAVSGFGEAPASDPAVQAGALRLAWARAAAIAAALRADGVPASAMTVDAYAPGGGGAARLVPAG